MRAIESHPIKLITLDLGLGGENGLELARKVMAARNVPIIIITGRTSPMDRVAGLEQGADDYITKPFHIKEVVHRVRSVLRRYDMELLAAVVAGAPSATAQRLERFAFDACILDAGKRDVRRADGAALDLTETEFQLLKLFLRHPQRVFSREEISVELRRREWTPFDRTLDGHIARLRRKIEPPGDEPAMIKSVRGVGYVFTGEVWSV